MLRNSYNIQMQQLKNKIEKMDKGQSLKSSLNSNFNNSVENLRVKELEEENKKLSKEIVLLQSNPKYDDEDYLLLQQKLDKQQRYVTELEQQLINTND